MGSVRQLTNASGSVTFGQAFDPFGNSLGWSGMDGSSYGYAGEGTDASGLQYLRARYYSPAQGRFINKDPFPGFQSQPSTLNAYAYVTNNPLLMSDPSGEIAPLLVAAGLGGLIGAGIDAGVQLYNMQPASFGQAIRCMNWGEVGVSFAAGAVAGLTGFSVFSGMTALMGTGFLANVAAGAISGVVAGQYGRLTGLVLSGQISQAGTVLFRPQDMVVDAVLGGAIAGIGYGIRQIGSPCSFSKDTLVVTQEGEKPIDEVEIGDKVLAYDEKSRSTGYFPVVNKFVHLDQEIVALVIDGETIEATPEHPFFTEEKGWVPAGELWIGAHIYRANGLTGIVERITIRQSDQMMFNLSVNQAHTFYVGNQQLLVHNTCLPKGAMEAAQAQRRVGLTGPGNPTTATLADGSITTHSGWSQRSGYIQGTKLAIKLAKDMGFKFAPHQFDPISSPGSYYASHAEVQLAALAPNQPIGVSNPMCVECQRFFSRLAVFTGQPQYIKDPFNLWIFNP